MPKPINMPKLKSVSQSTFQHRQENNVYHNCYKIMLFIKQSIFRLEFVTFPTLTILTGIFFHISLPYSTYLLDPTALFSFFFFSYFKDKQHLSFFASKNMDYLQGIFTHFQSLPPVRPPSTMVLALHTWNNLQNSQTSTLSSNLHQWLKLTPLRGKDLGILQQLISGTYQ